MIEVVEIDGVSLSMMGDYFETLILLKSRGELVEKWCATIEANADEVVCHETGNGCLLQSKEIA